MLRKPLRELPPFLGALGAVPRLHGTGPGAAGQGADSGGRPVQGCGSVRTSVPWISIEIVERGSGSVPLHRTLGGEEYHRTRWLRIPHRIVLPLLLETR